MMKAKRILLSILLGCAFNSVAHSIESDDTSIRQLINQYAETHRANFIISPEVKGNVNLLGLTVEGMSNSDLIDIFNQHGFIAIKKGGLVQVFTQFEVENLGKGIGPIWRGQ
jgi:type II secretory pathway component GspD/PulD (secretin)